MSDGAPDTNTKSIVARAQHFASELENKRRVHLRRSAEGEWKSVAGAAGGGFRGYSRHKIDGINLFGAKQKKKNGDEAWERARTSPSTSCFCPPLLVSSVAFSYWRQLDSRGRDWPPGEVGLSVCPSVGESSPLKERSSHPAIISILLPSEAIPAHQ